MNLRYLIIIAALVLIAGCRQNNERSIEQLASEMQAAMDNSIKNAGAVGVSVALVTPDGKLWKGAAGISHAGVPVTTDMLFDIGSVEKNLQAALVLKLVEENVLALEDRVDKWLPAYPNIPGEITVRQIMNLTSGIDKFVDDSNSPWRTGYENIDFEKTWTWEEIYSGFIGKPRFAPGTKCEYSTTNYILLKLIVEKATQSKQSMEVKERILKPNNLNHTLVDFADPIPSRYSIAHAWYDPGNGQLQDITGNSLNWLATLSPLLVYSTADDLASYIDALFHKKTILSVAALEEMLDFVGPVQNEPMLKGYGLGVADINFGVLFPRWSDVEVYGHLGSQYGYTTFAGYFPKIGLSLVMMFNRGADRSTMDSITPAANAIVDALLAYSGIKSTIADMLKELEKSPGDVHLMYRIAKTYQENKDDYEAALMYKEILERDPGDKYGYKVESLFWNASYDGVIWKKPEGLVKFIAEHGDYKEIKNAYKFLAKTYKRRGEMENAVQVYMDAIDAFTDDADFRNHFAWWIYENKQQKHYEAAIEVAESALEMKPDTWYIWDTLAWLYHEKGDRSNAVAAAERALSLAPESDYKECENSLEKIKKEK